MATLTHFEDERMLPLIAFFFKLNGHFTGGNDILIDRDGANQKKITFEHGHGKKDTSTKHYIFTFEFLIDDLKNLNTLELSFSAHGLFGNKWEFNNFSMLIYFTN